MPPAGQLYTEGAIFALFRLDAASRPYSILAVCRGYIAVSIQATTLIHFHPYYGSRCRYSNYFGNGSQLWEPMVLVLLRDVFSRHCATISSPSNLTHPVQFRFLRMAMQPVLGILHFKPILFNLIGLQGAIIFLRQL